jgi:biotin synthase
MSVHTEPSISDASQLADLREQVLERGEGLSEQQILSVLTSPDELLPDLLELAHDVRMKWCGPEVEVEGIVSLKTGGCPEDCHFCSQSGQFTSPVRSVWLNIPELVKAAEQTAATGASEFCIVAAVRGPDERLMSQMREGVKAIKEAVDIEVAASLGMLTQEQVDDLVSMGVHRYNHNLEAARSYFPNVVTTHSWEERWDTCEMVRNSGMELCCGCLVGMGETVEQRAELAAQLAELQPDEVPLNFLNPRPGTPFGDLPLMESKDALRTIAAFRLAMPRTPIGGRVGERLGSGTGSSLEFQDYRPYAPGDDLRHVDWAAYARSELLAVRLYREEVSPRIDLVLDVSRSMAVTDRKSRAYGDLAGLLACACASTVADTRIITTSAAQPERLNVAEDIERALACDATLSALEHGHLPFRRRSLRVVVSDFLFPHDADPLVSRLARDSALLSIVQFTLREEAQPAVEGGRRLIDVEGGGELDLVIDETAILEYRARFSRLRLGLSQAARRAGARFAHVVAETPIRDVARGLAAAGILEGC